MKRVPFNRRAGRERGAGAFYSAMSRTGYMQPEEVGSGIMEAGAGQ